MASSIEVTRGDTPTIRVGPITRDGTEVDLTGASATMTARRTLNSAVAFSTTDAEFDIDDAYVLVHLVEDDTEGLTPGKYVYDVEVIEADGTKTTFPEGGSGRLKLKADVTQ